MMRHLEWDRSAGAPLSVYVEYTLLSSGNDCDWRDIQTEADVRRAQAHLHAWNHNDAPLAICEGPVPTDWVTTNFEANEDIHVWLHVDGAATPIGKLAYIITNGTALETLRRAAVPIHQTVDGLFRCLADLGDLRIVVHPIPSMVRLDEWWRDNWLRYAPDVSCGVFVCAILCLVLCTIIRRWL